MSKDSKTLNDRLLELEDFLLNEVRRAQTADKTQKQRSTETVDGAARFLRLQGIDVEAKWKEFSKRVQRSVPNGTMLDRELRPALGTDPVAMPMKKNGRPVARGAVKLVRTIVPALSAARRYASSGFVGRAKAGSARDDATQNPKKITKPTPHFFVRLRLPQGDVSFFDDGVTTYVSVSGGGRIESITLGSKTYADLRPSTTNAELMEVNGLAPVELSTFIRRHKKSADDFPIRWTP